MSVFLTALRRVWHQTMTIATLVTVIIGLNLGFLSLPSHAATMSAKSSDLDAKLDRAYEETEAAGVQEDIYQQRLKEGQDPEKMPGPFKRFVDAEGKEVPETSLIETSVSKVRELTEKVTGK